MGAEFWIKEISKEMLNMHIEFEKIDIVTPYDTRKGKIRPGYDHVNVPMIFDINMDGKFTRKSILVADGHTTAPPSSITHSRDVSR